MRIPEYQVLLSRGGGESSNFQGKKKEKRKPGT